MNETELLEWNKRQIDEILRHKWIESEKAGHDIGENAAALDWIRRYSSDFRKEFMASKKEPSARECAEG